MLPDVLLAGMIQTTEEDDQKHGTNLEAVENGSDGEVASLVASGE